MKPIRPSPPNRRLIAAITSFLSMVGSIPLIRWLGPIYIFVFMGLLSLFLVFFFLWIWAQLSYHEKLTHYWEELEKRGESMHKAIAEGRAEIVEKDGFF